MSGERIIIAGGGAAGFFAAIACAEAQPENDIRIYERSSHFLTKVRISGGGRCNVTHTALEPQYRNAVEFRHSSWWRESVYRRFEEHGLTFCAVSAPRLPDDLIKTNDVIYARLHGRSRWYRHDYSDEELDCWAAKISDSGAREAWIYFDNDRDAYAIKNAHALIQRLRDIGHDVQ